LPVVAVGVAHLLLFLLAAVVAVQVVIDRLSLEKCLAAEVLLSLLSLFYPVLITQLR
jgi:hypothetical protein